MAVSNFQQLQLLPKNPIDNLEISCVYKIWIGRKYYIGKTKDLKNRIRCHEYDLRRHVKNHPLGIINVFYQYMVQHIVDKKITKCYFEVVGLCKDEDARVRLEQMLFNTCCDDRNCLNYGFESWPYVAPHNPKPKKEKPVKPVSVIGIKKPAEPPKPIKHLTNAQKLRQLRKSIASIAANL